MSVTDRRARLFEDLARLRRAERAHPDDPDIAAVRERLQVEIGPIVSRSLAGRLLGVSHTAVGKWIRAGELPVVTDSTGCSGVPVEALLALHEQVTRTRGSRQLHILEPAMTEGRRRAAMLDPRAIVELGADARIDPHDRAALRSLAYHRVLAKQLRRVHLHDARRRLRRWEADGRIDPRYAAMWEEILSQPLADVRRAIADDSRRGTDLRQNSPLAGALSEAERRKILSEIR